jgi:hypothetical protein
MPTHQPLRKGQVILGKPEISVMCFAGALLRAAGTSHFNEIKPATTRDLSIPEEMDSRKSWCDVQVV